MSDLISRKDAYHTLTDYYHHKTDVQHDALRDALDRVPSAESERKSGKWVNGMLYYDFDESEWEKVKCSVCGNFVIKQIFYHDNKYHYCPYCGAKMERDER